MSTKQVPLPPMREPYQMTERKPGSSYGCEVAGCERHLEKGDTIYRTSPMGGPFRGRCLEHLETPPDPEVQDICEIIAGWPGA